MVVWTGTGRLSYFSLCSGVNNLGNKENESIVKGLFINYVRQYWTLCDHLHLFLALPCFLHRIQKWMEYPIRALRKLYTVPKGKYIWGIILTTSSYIYLNLRGLFFLFYICFISDLLDLRKKWLKINREKGWVPWFSLALM